MLTQRSACLLLAKQKGGGVVEWCIQNQAIRRVVLAKMSAKLGTVLVTRNVPGKAVELLAQRCDIVQWKSDDAVPRSFLEEKISKADGLFCLLTDAIDADLLDKAVKLKVIATMSVGYDHIDVSECKKRKLKLGHTPDVSTDVCAELTVSLLLCTSRRLIEANKQVHNGGWGIWSPKWMCGRGLQGSVVGIVGLGRIGFSVAQKLKTFKPEEILYFDIENPQAAELGAVRVSLEELLTRSDFVSIHTNLSPETRHMFNKKSLAFMKPTATLVNTSRGPLVDQNALYDALTNGKLGAAGLDVCCPEPIPTDHKLLTLHNCVVLPHVGSATWGARESMAVLTAENIIAALEGYQMPAPIP